MTQTIPRLDVMPPPPKGMVWVLKLNIDHGDFMLWLYKRSRFTGRSNGLSVMCSTVTQNGFRVVSFSASDDEVVERTIVTAHEMLRDIEKDPAREATANARAAVLSARLGIQVQVRKR